MRRNVADELPVERRTRSALASFLRCWRPPRAARHPFDDDGCPERDAVREESP